MFLETATASHFHLLASKEQGFMMEATFKLWALLAMVSYMVIQRTLRFKRSRELQRSFGFPGRSLSTMTTKEAQAIQSDLGGLEFPAVFQKSLEFALFRVRTVLPGRDSFADLL